MEFRNKFQILNQYSSVTSASSAVTNLGYDSNGNLTNGGTIQSGLFFYDAQNRLTRAVVSGNTTDFDYDSKNRVVKRSLNSTPTFLIYDGWNLIDERNATGIQQARYVHGVNTDEILTKTDSTGVVYYHHDGLGSVTQITTAIGTMIERYLYDIFGRVTMLALSGVVITTSSRGNRFFFTGRERIAEAGIYDYRNRVYSESLGRFLQTDPIRFSAGDVNIYRYCHNNSVNCTDPLGLDGKKETPTPTPTPTVPETKPETPKTPPDAKTPPETEPKPKEGGSAYADDVLRGLDAVKDNPSLLNPTSEIGNQAWQEGFKAGGMFASTFSGGGGAKAVFSAAAKYTAKEIAKREYHSTQKGAREAAQRAGDKNKPVHHPHGEHGPHYHPGDGKGQPASHDHYYYRTSR